MFDKNDDFCVMTVDEVCVAMSGLDVEVCVCANGVSDSCCPCRLARISCLLLVRLALCREEV